MSLSDSFSVTVAEALTVGLGLLLFGYLVIDAVARGRELERSVRVGLAFTGVVGYALVLMLAHMATGGAVFSRPAAVRVVTIVLFIGLVVLKVFRHRVGEVPRLSRQEGLAIAALLILALTLWGSPVARMLPVGHIGDQNLHMGWANQLINGQPTPTSAQSGEIPNYYPWLFHALVALIASLTAGGRAFHAQGALLLLQVGGAVLTLYALGKALTGKILTGAAVALFGALSGGVGFIMLRGPDFVFNPRADDGSAALDYLGDLLFRRSYNSSFHNLAPVFPRDVVFVLTTAFLLLLIAGVKQKRTGLFAAAGIVLGFIGLTGAEAFIVLVGATVAVGIVARQGKRVAAATVLPGVCLWALWSLPLAINYLRLDGFVNTASAPVTLTFFGLLGSWGVTTPFAVVGLIRRVRSQRADLGTVVMVTMLVVAGAAVLLSGFVPRLLGSGFTTLGRQHRYWPLLHLTLAIFAGLGASAVTAKLRRRGRLPAAILVAATVALAVPSPLLASLALPEKIPAPPVLTASLLGDPASPLNTLALGPGRRCTVAAPHEIAMQVFGYTGYRFVSFPLGADDPSHARVRWRAVYEAEHEISERAAANQTLIEGTSRQWEAVADRYEVDAVLVRTDGVNPGSGLEGWDGPKTSAYGSVYVARVTNCTP